MRAVPKRGVWIGLAVLLVLVVAGALYAMRSLVGTCGTPKKNAGAAAELPPTEVPNSPRRLGR